MSKTFGMVKPNAVLKGERFKIADKIEESGLVITQTKLVTLKKEAAEKFYAEHKLKPFFNELIEFMTSGSVMAMVIEGDDAVKKYREVIGNTDPQLAEEGTIRKLFAVKKSENSVHGSDSPEAALREIEFFFGENGFKTS